MEIREIEEKIVNFWRKDKTFEKSLKKTKKGKPYVFGAYVRDDIRWELEENVGRSYSA